MSTRTLAAVLLLAGTSAWAQTQALPPARDRPVIYAPGAGAINGSVVTDDDRRAPLRRALVTLTRAGVEDMRSTSSDDQGRYVFEELPAGTYRLSASKAGFVSASFGAPKSGLPGSAITLSEAQRLPLSPVALMRGGVIAGRITDALGKPVQNAGVQVAQMVIVNGVRGPRIGSGATGSATTNAHGDYRVYGLLSGDYVVSATLQFGLPATEVRASNVQEVAWATRLAAGPASAAALPMPTLTPLMTVAPTLYPGTTDIGGATVISLAPGEERVSVDFPMSSVPTARISGVVRRPDGSPAPNVSVSYGPRSKAFFGPTVTRFTDSTDASGGFLSPGLPPGDYVVIARPSAAPITLFGTTTVTLAGLDVRDVGLQLQAAPALSGVVVTDRSPGAPSDVDVTTVQIRLVPEDVPLSATLSSASMVTSAKPDGSFRVDGLVPGAYRITTSLPPRFSRTWGLKSAMVGGRDMVDLPVEIQGGQDVAGVRVTFTDRLTELSGALISAPGQPAPGFYIFVFSADRAHWTTGSRRIAYALASRTGTYSIAGLPPGEYYLCALTELDTTLQYDATYLEQFIPASMKLTLGEGEKRTQDLRIGG